MKKLSCLILTILFLLPVLGCQRQDAKLDFTFYYPRTDYGYNTQEGKFYNSIIEPEIRENISYQSARQMINLYLNGPVTQTLTNPFPKDLSLETISIENHVLHITVSDHLSELTGIRLMIACACLGRTGMELTNTFSVRISCETALLDGQRFVFLDSESIIFDDTVTVIDDE